MSVGAAAPPGGQGRPVSGMPLLLQRGCEVVAGATLTLALAAMAAQVVFRYAIGSSLVWSEEVARYALIWSAMIGSAAAYLRASHVAVTVLVDQLPARLAGLARGTIHTVVLAFAGLLAWHGALLTYRNFERDQLSPALQVPIAWTYLAIPVGALLIGVAALLGVWREVSRGRAEG